MLGEGRAYSHFVLGSTAGQCLLMTGCELDFCELDSCELDSYELDSTNHSSLSGSVPSSARQLRQMSTAELSLHVNQKTSFSDLSSFFASSIQSSFSSEEERYPPRVLYFRFKGV